MHTRQILGVILISSIVLVSSSIRIYEAQSNSYPEEPHAASAMWIEPSEIEISAREHPVGTKFNVTLWANTSFTCQLWQFELIYNKNHLNAVRCEFTAGSKSDFFKDITCLGAIVYGSHNSTHDYVKAGETWFMNPPMRSPGYGSLSWVEFNITAAPPEKQEFTSLISISEGDTLFLDESSVTPPFTAYDSMYTYTAAFPWDVTGDDYVGIDDIVSVAEHFGETP